MEINKIGKQYGFPILNTFIFKTKTSFKKNNT